MCWITMLATRGEKTGTTCYCCTTRKAQGPLNKICLSTPAAGRGLVLRHDETLSDYLFSNIVQTLLLCYNSVLRWMWRDQIICHRHVEPHTVVTTLSQGGGPKPRSLMYLSLSKSLGLLTSHLLNILLLQMKTSDGLPKYVGGLISPNMLVD